MDERRALIQHQLTLTHRVIGRFLADLTDDESARRPDGILAPVVWQVGHLAGADLKFLEVAGIGSPMRLPEGYAALFRPGSGAAALYPSLRDVAGTFDATHDALSRAVPEADLDAVIDHSPGPFATAAEMFSFTAAHRWYHIGKISSLRAMLGKPRLFG